jgi:RNA 2',3'-cyclic 3'-phosphodiesterase
LTANEKMRLFVALELPASWTAALGQMQDKMRSQLAEQLGVETPRLRWTRPEGIHLTLKFLGETPALKSAAIDQALRESVEGMRRFSLTLGKAGSFGDRRGPRVLFVDTAGDLDTLLELARRVDWSLGHAGFPREQRPFQPHLTLARLPEEIPAAVRQQVADAALGVRTPRPGPHQFLEVSLMRSHLERGGARYERIRSYKLT